MKKNILFLLLLLILSYSTLYSQQVKELQETARTFMQQGDFSNAILVLQKAMHSEPSNIEITKDLALNYHFQKDNTRAMETIRPLLDRDDADEQCFQIAGNIYKQQENTKDCEKLYKKGIKKFPESGPLYNDYGELLWAQKNYDAIRQWEKGIEKDPSYSRNYYNACEYYYFTTDRVWSIIYGEIFLNMEPFGTNAPEIKNTLLESYKKIYSIH